MASLCPSAHSHWGLSWNLNIIFGTFKNNCREARNVEISRNLHEDLSTPYCRRRYKFAMKEYLAQHSLFLYCWVWHVPQQYTTTYCCVSISTLGTRKRQNVALHVHCLPRFSCFLRKLYPNYQPMTKCTNSTEHLVVRRMHENQPEQKLAFTLLQRK